MEQLIEIIRTIIIAISNNFAKTKKQSPVLLETRREKKKVNKKNKITVSDKIKKAASIFQYEDDLVMKANNYSRRVYKKSVAVIHFSWTNTLKSLSDYFHKHARTNATWGIGKDGKVHTYLPLPGHPSFTQGVKIHQKGGFINSKGRRIKNVNNIACSFEIVNRNYEEYTEKQYEAVAVRLLWMLKYYPDFRIWYTVGHEQIIPIRKDDPGRLWDWEKLFVKYCGVTKEFYDEYLSYLQETSAYGTVGDIQRSDRKLFEVRQGIDKLITLVDKNKDYCF